MSTKEWSVSYWHYMPGSSSPMQMMKGAMKCMQCGGVKEGETVLISTDTNKLGSPKPSEARPTRWGRLPLL